MKRNIIIALALILAFALIPDADAYTYITTDNQSRTLWNETYTGNENHTIGFILPANSTAINATLNVSGVGGSAVPAESKKTVKYASAISQDGADSLANLGNANDTNWGTFAGGTHGELPFSYRTYHNFTYNSQWISSEVGNLTIIAQTNATAGVTTNLYLWDYTIGAYSVLLAQTTSASEPINTTIYNLNISKYVSSGNPLILKTYISGVSNNNQYFEAQLLWYNFTYPNNTYIDTADSFGVSEWSYAGELNPGAGSKQANLNATLINSYCSSISGACNFTIKAHSDTPGILQFSNVSIPYVPYVVASESYLNSALENSIPFSITIDTNSNVSEINASLMWNGTSYTATRSGNTFSKTLSTSLSAINATIPWYWNFSYNYSGNIDTSNTTSRNQTVYRIYLGNCSDGISTTKALTLYLLDEENSTAINGTIEISNNITASDGTNSNYSFTFSAITNASICIYPAWASFTDDAMLQYYSTGYTSRTYFIDTTISNVTQLVNLYLLQNGNSYSTLFFLRDQNNNPYTDAIIQIERYFVGTNTYKTVAQCKSDSPTGKCATYLKTNDVYYRYIISLNQTVVRMTTPSVIVCTSFESITFCPPYPIPISISTLGSANYFSRIGNVQVSVTVNNATNILSATVVDTSGTMTTSYLNVEKKGAMEFYNICNSTAQSSATTFTCDLGNRTGNIYQYDFSGIFDGNNISLSSNVLDYRSGAMDWGDYGPLLAFLIIGTLYFFGRHHPVAAIGYMCIGLVVVFLLGMTPLASGITSLVGIIIVFAIIAWRLK